MLLRREGQKVSKRQSRELVEPSVEVLELLLEGLEGVERYGGSREGSKGLEERVVRRELVLELASKTKESLEGRALVWERYLKMMQLR